MDLTGVTRPVVTPVRPDPTGRNGPTTKVARGRRWRRSSRGLYVPAGVELTTDQRIVEAAAALQEDWGGVTGWAALAWGGSVWFDGTPWGGGQAAPVTLAVGGNRWIREQQTFATSEERLAPGDLVLEDGIRITTAVRSVCFEMRYARSLWDAVTVLDMACFNDAVSIDEVHEYATTLNGWTGIPLCRDALPLARENAWSPREVWMRRAWGQCPDLGRPLCNQPVFDAAGQLLGVPDLIDPETGVTGEYDGRLHLEGRQRSQDIEREHRLRGHGLEPVTMVAGDAVDPTRFIARLYAAYERATRRSAAQRCWTLEQPDWWIDTTTVAARRALDEDQRSRLLHHRMAA